jgi:DNA-binding NtrC family response regulator
MINSNIRSGDLVLVVDDDGDALDEIADVLRDMELIVLTALNGEDAVKLARENRPDYVLMDYSLPGINGLVAVRTMRYFLPDTIFIMMSGLDDFCRVATTNNTMTFAILKKPLAINGIARFIRNKSQYNPPNMTVVDLLTS